MQAAKSPKDPSHRNNYIRLRRGEEVSLERNYFLSQTGERRCPRSPKRIECGILLNNFSDIHEGDILEAYEMTYIAQEL